MPDPLTLATDLELIGELRKRGIASVIVLIKQDSDTGREGAKVGVVLAGPPQTCLGLTALALGKAKHRARETGMSEAEITGIIRSGEDEAARDI